MVKYSHDVPVVQLVKKLDLLDKSVKKLLSTCLREWSVFLAYEVLLNVFVSQEDGDAAGAFSEFAQEPVVAPPKELHEIIVRRGALCHWTRLYDGIWRITKKTTSPRYAKSTRIYGNARTRNQLKRYHAQQEEGRTNLSHGWQHGPKARRWDVLGMSPLLWLHG